MKQAASIAVSPTSRAPYGPSGQRHGRAVLAFVAVAMVTALVNGCSSCKKDDDDVKPAPTSSAAPPPPAATATSVAVAPEEPAPSASAGAVDAGKRVVGPGGPGPGSGSLANCCDALARNANSAPLDQKAYYMAAQTYCNGMRNTPAGQQAFGQIRAFLQGAKMPAACTK